MGKLIVRIGLASAVAALVCGCYPAEPANYERTKPNSAQGPAGGEVGDKTSPVGTEALEPGNQTATVFPTTAQPG